MKSKVWILGLLLIGIAELPTRLGIAQDRSAPARAKGKKIVLLIGINKYKSPLLTDRRLNGCINDVNAVASLLPKFDGFPKEGDDRFHLLKDEQATRDAILATFDHVVRQV